MKLFWLRSKRTPKLSSPNLSQILRLSSTMENGLRSGRDWISILKWISQNDSDPRIQFYLKSFVQKLKVDAVENVLKSERKNSKDLLWRLFLEILLQAHRGSQHLSHLFQSYSEIVYSISKIREKEKSLLFIPKFQAWVALAITLSFTVGLPLFAPGVFPTFLSLKRYDLFFAGFGLLIVGIGLLIWMCQRPKRLLAPLLSASFFFYFLSIYIEAGLDLASAWCQAVETVDFSPKFKSKLLRRGLNVESMDLYLRSLQSQMPEPWPGILTGLIWTRASGLGLSSYLKATSHREGERVLHLWEDEIRKLTLTSLLPIGFFIFIPTLFLLVGPQLLRMSLYD